jgi:hypothetical protein
MIFIAGEPGFRSPASGQRGCGDSPCHLRAIAKSKVPTRTTSRAALLDDSKGLRGTIASVTERPSTVENPWDDPAFVALYEADVEAEKRGEIEEGLTREEFAAQYAKYLPAP